MGYVIKQDLIPGLPRNPYRKGDGAYEGVVGHSTATPEATAATEVKYFKNNWKDREAFVHFFVDWTDIIQTADTAYKAWGAGNGNPRFVHVELCETKDPVKFAESYKRYVWILAKILKDKYLGVSDGGTLVSHAWVSKNLGGTDHEDPIGYLKSHGVSWSQLVADVKVAYEGKKEGWVKDDSKWFFYKGGVKQVGWVKDKNKWYFLDANGVMKTGWVKDKDKWYYLLDNGEMMGGGRHTINGKDYFFQPDGALIITDKDGVIISG